MNNLRTLHLLKIFSQKTDSEHRLATPSLIGELKKHGITAERKSIYRDIAALKKVGFSIVSSSRGYYLEKQFFSQNQIKALLLAANSVPFITSSMYEEIKEKLISCASNSQHGLLSCYSTVFSEKEETAEQFLLLDAAMTAHAQGKMLAVSDSELMLSKSVNVLGILNHGGGFYIICHEDDKPIELIDIRTLCEASVSPQNSTPKPLPKLSDNDSIKRFLASFTMPPVSAVFKCDSRLRKAISDKFGSSAKLSKTTASHFSAMVSVSPTEELVSWIAQFGGGIEVLSPESLRNDVYMFLKSAVSKYEK